MDFEDLILSSVRLFSVSQLFFSTYLAQPYFFWPQKTAPPEITVASPNHSIQVTSVPIANNIFMYLLYMFLLND